MKLLATIVAGVSISLGVMVGGFKLIDDAQDRQQAVVTNHQETVDAILKTLK